MTSPAHHPNDTDRLARPDDIERVLERARALGWLALDTEFLRQDTYDPELCLVQIASDAEALLIEGLDAHPAGRPPKRPPVPTPQAAALDCLLRALAPETANTESTLGENAQPSRATANVPTLVVHSGVQDFEILRLIRPGLLELPPRPESGAAGDRSLGNAAPRPTRWPLDTQIAASFLGGPYQASYQWLVENRLGVTLDKTQSRTDWSQRPLSAAQRQYALDDVIYLAELVPGLMTELNQRGRMGMVREETERLYIQALTLDNPDNLWRRIKGAQRLPPGALAVLREVAIWREDMAVRHNRPRRWIIADDIAIQLARNALKPGFTLTLRGGRAGKWQPADIDALRAHIENGLRQPPERHPRWPARPVGPLPAEHAHLERETTNVHAKVIERLKQLGIASDWAGSAKGLLRWVVEPENVDSPWSSGWRQDIAGDLINPLRS